MPDVKVVDNVTKNSFHKNGNGDVSVGYKCTNSEATGD